MLPKPISLEPPGQRHPTAQPPSPAWHTKGPSSRAPCLASGSPPFPCGRQNRISSLMALLQGLPLPFSPSVSFPPSPTVLPLHPTSPAQPSPTPPTGSAAPRGLVPAGGAVCPSPTSSWTEAYPPILVELPLGPRAPWGLPSPGTSLGPLSARRLKNSPFCHPHPLPHQLGCAVSLCSPDFWPHEPPRSYPGLPVSGLSVPLH